MAIRSVLVDTKCSPPTGRDLHLRHSQPVPFSVQSNFQYQYNETNVMHFSFNLMRIKGLNMFRALVAHPQEALQKHHLVYCVRIMSVGCVTIAVNIPSEAVVRLLRMSKQCSKHVEALDSQQTE
jgi:hypothetical protein